MMTKRHQCSPVVPSFPRRRESRGFLWLVILCSSPVALIAQEKEPVYECPAQPAAKKDLKAEVLSRLEQITQKSRDAELLISVADTRRSQDSDKAVVLVDVRSAAAFAEVRIPGSLNIPLYALRTKNFLKSQHVVLIESGAAYERLAGMAARLTDAGFKTVSILDGGLNAWRKAKGPVVGSPQAQQRLLALTAKQYFAERNYDHWLIVDVSNEKTRGKTGKKSSEKTNANRKLFPNKIDLPYQKDEQHLLSALKNTLARHKASSRKNDKTFVVLLDSEGANSPRLAALINEMDSAQVFYLEGGIKAYRSYYQTQKMIMLVQARMQEAGSSGPKRRCEL